MNWIIKIRLVLIAVVACLCLSTVVIAQKAESFEILSRVSKTSQSGPELPLFNERGEIAGSFTVESVGDNKYQFRITLANGSQATVDALSVIFYSSQANRLYVVGAPLYSHVIAEAAIKVYTAGGELVNDLGVVAHHPFTVGLSPSGDLFVAGNPEPGSSQYFLKKINIQGNEVWSVPILKKDPYQIKFSANGSYVGVVLEDSDRNTSSLHVYNNSGQLLHKNNTLNSIAAFEIIGNDKVVLSDGHQWFLYPLQSSNLTAWGALKGNVLGANPITSSPSGDWFTIVTLGNPETASGYRVQAFESSTGQLMKESLFGGLPVWRSSRFVTIENDNNLKLVTEVETIRLKMD